VWAASRLGGALAPLLLVPLMRVWGWRAIFWVMGGIGGVWSVAWFMWFRNFPHEMRGITDEELDAIALGRAAEETHSGVPWKKLLGLPQLWLLVAAYFCYAWGSWFYFGWFSTWMVRGAGFSVAQMGVFASLPFLMGMLGNLAGGVWSERLVKRLGLVRAYRRVTSSALVIGGLLMLGMSVTRGHAGVVVFATLGFGVMDLMLPSAWAMCMALGGRYGGTASAVMNTAGNLGGWFCTVLFGYVVKATGDYNLPVRVVAGMVVLAALLFSRVDCSRGLGEATGAGDSSRNEPRQRNRPSQSVRL
jgi:predicted MFS family arabinose efflux permease